MATLQKPGESDEDYIVRYEQENPLDAELMRSFHEPGGILEESVYKPDASVYRTMAALQCFIECEERSGQNHRGIAFGGVVL